MLYSTASTYCIIFSSNLQQISKVNFLTICALLYISTHTQHCFQVLFATNFCHNPPHSFACAPRRMIEMIGPMFCDLSANVQVNHSAHCSASVSAAAQKGRVAGEERGGANNCRDVTTRYSSCSRVLIAHFVPDRAQTQLQFSLLL